MNCNLSDADLLSVGVPAAKVDRFRGLLKSAHRQWLPPTPRQKTPQPLQSDILPYLDKLIAALEPLGDGEKGEAAGVLWAATLSKAGCTLHLDEIIETVERAKAWAKRDFKIKSSPPGSRTAATGFEDFLMLLFVAADVCGFEWTAYKDRVSKEAVGTLPRLLKMLNLPATYLPTRGATLVNTIERVRRKVHPTKSAEK